MLDMLRYSLLLVLSMTLNASFAQDDVKVVQFSGRTIEMTDNGIQNLIYTNIAVQGTPRGTTSDIDGFFSIPVREGETVLFSRVGYEVAEVLIPGEIEGTVYSKDVILKRDTLFLPEALVLPWPDKDFFKIEFLALEVNNAIEEIVQENLSPEKLDYLVQILPPDGGETSKIELRQAASSYYYFGQIRPQNIFNPLSWKKFIDAIRRGDFKKNE